MPRYNVLFLCTGNSSRSIMADAILRHRGAPMFASHSAGSHPTGYVHPQALATIEAARLPVHGLRSKSWDEFSGPVAPRMDFIFTLCDSAAKEACPVWPGHPMTAHWGLPDPGAAPPGQLDRAFRDAFATIGRRIGLFLALPLESLEQIAIQQRLREIGKN